MQVKEYIAVELHLLYLTYVCLCANYRGCYFVRQFDYFFFFVEMILAN